MQMTKPSPGPLTCTIQRLQLLLYLACHLIAVRGLLLLLLFGLRALLHLLQF
jgi:hypothetical protein